GDSQVHTPPENPGPRPLTSEEIARERNQASDVPGPSGSLEQRRLDEEFVSELPPSPRPSVPGPSDKPGSAPCEGLLSDEELAALLEREL
ncbi:MAG: hypothetical protein ACLFV7_05340, partial [Phycisphaerae bacterium]